MINLNDVKKHIKKRSKLPANSSLIIQDINNW